MLFIVTGRAGSGKTVIAKEISKQLEIPLLETSSYLKQIGEVEDNHKQRNKMHDVKYEFQNDDPDWLWKYIEKDLDQFKGNCVLSGIREPYLLYKILSRYEGTLVVGLESSLFNRYARMCERDGYLSTEKFFAFEEGDTDLGIEIVLSGCDIIVNNDVTLKQVVNAILQIISKRMLGR